MTHILKRKEGLSSFYQIVHLVEIQTNKIGIIGALGPVYLEPFRFRAQFGLGFPASEIGSIRVLSNPDNSNKNFYAEMEVNALGLYGSASPLPASITERLISYDDTGTLRDFLDIFNHRLISLLYRIWRSSRIELLRNEALDDAFSYAVLCLAGIGNNDIDDISSGNELLSSFQHISGWTRSSQDLIGFLTVQFPHVTWSIEEFVPCDFIISSSDRWYLGQKKLGEDIVLGESLVDITNRISLRAHLADWYQHQEFLPGRAYFEKITHLIRRFLRDPLDVHLILLLNPAFIQPIYLNEEGVHLGLNSWLAPSGGRIDVWPSFPLPHI